MTCPGDIELARALAIGADAELAAHLGACETCRAAWDGARAAIELARALPAGVPPASRREEVRTAVLAAVGGLAETGRPRRRAWIAPVIAGAAAAGAVGYLALSHASAPVAGGHSHGTVRPHAGARYVTSAGPDEIIRLSDGEIDVDVEPLHPGERFRVVVGTTELEVHGTAFTVTASAEHLVAVAVAHGRVDLHPDAGAPATLATGQSWHAAVAAAIGPARPVSPALTPPPAPPAHAVASSASPSPASPSPAFPPHPSRVAPPRKAIAPSAARSEAPGSGLDPAPAPPAPSRPAPAPPPRSADEVSYDDAWTALRTGAFARAASGFARVLLAAPDGPLAEDAGFWRAVALARGKRSAEAMSAFRDFLDAYPRSVRAGEASAMLGWLLVDARTYDEAARRFTAASGDPDPAIRRSAQAGLDALATRAR
jgi:hypothetical protein